MRRKFRGYFVFLNTVAMFTSVSELPFCRVAVTVISPPESVLPWTSCISCYSIAMLETLASFTLPL